MLWGADELISYYCLSCGALQLFDEMPLLLALVDHREIDPSCLVWNRKNKQTCYNLPLSCTRFIFKEGYW